LVLDAENVTKIIGSAEADVFHVQDNETASTTQLTLNGGLAPDTYNFYANSAAGHTIDVKIDDEGEGLKDENVINVYGTSGDDVITTSSNGTTGGTVTFGNNQTVEFVAPDPNAF